MVSLISPILSSMCIPLNHHKSRCFSVKSNKKTLPLESHSIPISSPAKSSVTRQVGVSYNKATPSYHPFLDGIFPNKNHPFYGVSRFMETLTYLDHQTSQVVLLQLLGLSTTITGVINYINCTLLSSGFFNTAMETCFIDHLWFNLPINNIRWFSILTRWCPPSYKLVV